jgi:Domain of unknown function (DUF4340)
MGLETPPMKLRTNWVLLAIIVVLLGYIGVSEWRSRQRSQAEGETLGRFDPHKVDEVRFTVGGETATVVREADGRWRLTHPFQAEADGPTILSLLTNLKELQVLRVITAPDNLEQYGLTQPRIITLREHGSPFSTHHTYHLGEISPVHYVCPLDYWIYAQRQGEQHVLVVEGYQLNQLMPRTPGDLRNRNLLSFNPHTIRKVEVTVADTTYTAVQISEGWMQEGHGERAPFTYMRQVLFTLANLRAVPAEGQNNADPAVLGLDQPVARVTLYTDRPEPVEMMRFGKRHAVQGAVYVRRESTRAVYLVSSDILDELRRPTLSSTSLTQPR